MSNERVPNWVKVLMLKGEKGDYPILSEEPIDNGYKITAENPDGTTFSFNVTNATSGDYSGLTNKPSINGTLLSGNKTGEDLSLAPLPTMERITPTMMFDGQNQLTTVTIGANSYAYLLVTFDYNEMEALGRIIALKGVEIHKNGTSWSPLDDYEPISVSVIEPNDVYLFINPTSSAISFSVSDVEFVFSCMAY